MAGQGDSGVSKPEGGLRWWAVKVIVPLLGGGGVIALLVTNYFPKKTVPEILSKPNPSCATIPISDRYHNANCFSFYVHNEATDQDLPGNTLNLKYNDPFILRWNVDKDAIEGSLNLSHVEKGIEGPRESVGNEGHKAEKCDKPGESVYELSELLDHKYHPLSGLYVVCEKPQ